MIDLGGFAITYTQQIQIIAVVILYSVIVVGLGLYVKKKEESRQEGRLAHFLTGGNTVSVPYRQPMNMWPGSNPSC